MATARLDVRQVQSPPPPPAFETYIDLRLSLDEARTLFRILMRVGGGRVDSRRRYAAAILNALNGVGIYDMEQDVEGSITFLRTD